MIESSPLAERRVYLILAVVGATVLQSIEIAVVTPRTSIAHGAAYSVSDGWGRLSWKFDKYRRGARRLHFPALIGTMWLVGLTTILALPVGVGAAIYLEEYGKGDWLARLIEINIANLAGVPSIIYGLLGLGLFVRTLGFGRSVLAGAATLALLALPIVILSSREHWDRANLCERVPSVRPTSGDHLESSSSGAMPGPFTD